MIGNSTNIPINAQTSVNPKVVTKTALMDKEKAVLNSSAILSKVMARNNNNNTEALGT